MSSTRPGVEPTAAVDPRNRTATVHEDMAHLTDLVDRLRHRLPTRALGDRELELTGGAVAPVVAEQQLRGIATLLLTLDTYLRGRRNGSSGSAPRGSADPEPSPVPAQRNGAPTPPTAGLAAAAARYIARDLAARQLSEFTSAEGYRLARELARIGRDEEAVEELLGQANQIRLHPVSLTEALSHSPH